MSSSEPGRREVAYRLFAAEFDDSEFAYSESDEERAPNYVVTPTGARVNRLFAVGVLTEIEDVNPEMIRGRVVDPTGAFVTYAGQYQPDALAVLERMEPPTFLSISGKARTFEPDDGDQIFTSVRPESVNEVDAETRDRWVLTTAERTRERIGIMASAIESDLVGDQLRAALVDAGVDDRLADGVALALDYYGTTPAYLSALDSLALDSVRVIAGEKDEAGRLDLDPGEGMGDVTPLATLDLSGAPSPETAATAAEISEAESTDSDSTIESDNDELSAPDTAATSESSSEPAVAADSDIDTASDADEIPDTTVETDTEPTDSTVESTTESAGEEAEDSTDIGEEPSDAAVEPSDTGEESAEAVPDDFDPGEFELDEEERREVEDEYGTDFSTADEVEPADIEPEGATEEPEPSPDADPETAEQTSDDGGSAELDVSDGNVDEDISDEVVAEETSTDADNSSDAATADEEPDDVDLETAVMETMKELDDGDGADEADLVSTIAEEYGADTDAISEAIEDALMSGQCYEPTDGTLKPI